MKNLAGSALTKQLTTLKSRIDITSPRLCDDVIHRLAPSLGQYIGGTIVDINPGAGLFSSKLHGFLNPRSHLLMESMQQRYLPFLQSLLDAPNSRYRLRDWDRNIFASVMDYLRQDLPPDVQGTEGAPQTDVHSNNSVLIVYNSAHQKSHKLGDDNTRRISMRSSEDQAYKFAHGARLRSNLFARGPVRLLMWVDDTEKRNLLPRTVAYRTKTTLFLEAHCRLEEVVGSADVPESKDLRRETMLDIQSAKRTTDRTADLNLPIAPGRVKSISQDAPELSGVSREWHNELRRLGKAFQNQEIPQFVGMPPGPLMKDKKHMAKSAKYTPEWINFTTMRQVLIGQNSDMARVEVLLEQQAAIDKLDLAAHRDKIGKADQDALFKGLDAKVTELDNELEYLKRTDLKKYMYKDDDRRAFAMTPPLLMWDRRSAEPLQVEDDEYAGSTPPALIDFQAKETDDLPLTDEQSTLFDFIATEMFAGAGRTNLEVLKKAAPGAYDALIPKVPELQDPRVGGRRHIASVRSRTLTPKMFHSIAMAWDAWPFKPPMVDLMPGITSSRRGFCT